MRIVTRAEFLAMPPNTVYCKRADGGGFQAMSFKYDTVYKDFVCQTLDGPEFDNTEELMDRYDAMEKGASFPLEIDMAGRDGLFEDDAKFMIFEKDDLERLRAEIDKAIAAAPEPPIRAPGYFRPPE